MASRLSQYLVPTLLAVAAVQGIGGLEFDVFNMAASTPGGIRFDQEIGIPFAKNVMKRTTIFIWNLLEENNPADRRSDVQVVHMLIGNYVGAAAITYGGACTINVSAPYLQGYQGDLRWGYTSLMYHEMTHIWQWYPPHTPAGLIEGIAEYTVLRANYIYPSFAKPGSGDRWDQGYSVTARFLEYCDGFRPGFVASLNRKMKYEWSVGYFVELLGKPVDQLWREYKEMYGGGRDGNVTVGRNLRSLSGGYRNRYNAVKVGTGCQLNG